MTNRNEEQDPEIPVEEHATHDKNDNHRDTYGAELTSALRMPQPGDFKALGISETLAARCKGLGCIKPTLVQAGCIPVIMQGQNVIARSPTGTGKTLAFALPIIEKCGKDPHPGYCLILTPTRELATQIADQFRTVSGSSSNVCTVIGGVDFQLQCQELSRKPQFIVATPGRLADHFDGNKLETTVLFRKLKFLVFDEADRMLDGDYDEQLKLIMTNIPDKGRQTLFFSATLSHTVNELAESLSILSEKPAFQYNDFINQNDSEIDTRLKQHYVKCCRDYKIAYFFELLDTIRNSDTLKGIRKIVIFVAACRECSILSATMAEIGYSNVELNSQLSQKNRLAALEGFRAGRVDILVATNIACRGLDIRNVDLVINYDVPVATDYIHRAGRIRRHGGGHVFTFICGQRDVAYLDTIESQVGRSLNEFPMDVSKVMLILKEVTLARRAIISKLDSLPDSRQERRRIYERKRQILEIASGDESPGSDSQDVADVSGSKSNKRSKGETKHTIVSTVLTSPDDSEEKKPGENGTIQFIRPIGQFLI